MANSRVHYPIHYVAFAPYQLGSGFIEAHGVQSVNLTTNFNLEQIFELGQLDIYENIETVPDIEMTVEKVLDGYPLLYHLSSQTATSTTLLNRTNERCDVAFSIFSDGQDNSSGIPLIQCLVSGLFIDNISYSLPVDGPFTESVSLVGNDKEWRTSNFVQRANDAGITGAFDGTDSPASGVQRRQNVIMGAAPTGSVWPAEIPDMSVVNGSGYNIVAGATFVNHMQDVSVSVGLNRNSLFELGARREFFRFAGFPVEVTCEINVLAAGSDPSDGINALGDNEANLTDQPIHIKLSDSTHINLGTKNKLSSVTYSGGDSTGGEVIIAYSYSNFNILGVTQNSDPAGL